MHFAVTDSAAAVARDSLGRLVVAGVSFSSVSQVVVMRFGP